MMVSVLTNNGQGRLLMGSLMRGPFCEYYQGKSEICPVPQVTTQDTGSLKMLKYQKYFKGSNLIFWILL